jgi:hypothetical protein
LSRARQQADNAYISLLETDFNLANEKAWEIGATFDWGKSTSEAVKVPGLWTSFLYAEGFDGTARIRSGHVGRSHQRPLPRP